MFHLLGTLNEAVGRRDLFLYVIEGKAKIASVDADAGDVVWLAANEDPSHVSIEARAAVSIVAYSGAPIHEPVVAGGPFVAGSRAELQRAFEDLERGRFPRSASKRPAVPPAIVTPEPGRIELGRVLPLTIVFA